VGQFAFLVTTLVTGKGQVEVYTPAIDNEGRDAEIRRHLKRALAIGIQIKVAFYTTMNTKTAKYFTLRFSLLEDRVQNDPRLWYFFAYFDVSELRFTVRSSSFRPPCFTKRAGLGGRDAGSPSRFWLAWRPTLMIAGVRTASIPRIWESDFCRSSTMHRSPSVPGPPSFLLTPYCSGASVGREQD
jgi:hypothetical protein